MFEKKIEVDGPIDKLYRPTLDQLERDQNYQVKDSSQDKIEVKFGSWWSAKDNKRGFAELKFKRGSKTILLDFSFFSEILVASLVIYLPILFAVGLSVYGEVYIVSILMGLILLGFFKYHHYCFEKTAENYHSKFKNIIFVFGSDNFTFCKNCGHELYIEEGSRSERCQNCGSVVQEMR